VQIVAVWTGEFGLAVAQFLQTMTDVSARVEAVADGIPIRPWMGDEMLVVCAWREWPALFAHAESVAYAHASPWLPVVLEHPEMRVGPLVSPPRGPCHSCFTRRRHQHDPRRRITWGLHRAYDRDPSVGPRGFVSYQARLAAAIVTQIADDLATGKERSGTIVRLNLYTHAFARETLVPVAGCARCDSGSR
jgi:bacteriocin biosynthesis cyclodehydratase domain-containing protein